MLPKPAADKSGQTKALSVSYPIGNVPSEIHVFLNRLHGYPLYVATAKGEWLVKNGQISLIKPVGKTGQQK
jgi:hypothetical protein